MTIKEFSLTYGWAILASLITIGILAYFGVFSPGKYSPEDMETFCNNNNLIYYINNWENICYEIINETTIKIYRPIKINNTWYLEQ